MKAATGALLLAAALGGCVTTGAGSVAGSCKVFEAPPYAVRGATQYDQDWADSTIEGGIGGCNWKRPAPRPPELDAVPVRKAAAVHKKAKPAWLRMLQWPRKAVAPVVVVPEQPAPIAETVAVPPVPASAPPKPRSALDELLHPNGGE